METIEGDGVRKTISDEDLFYLLLKFTPLIEKPDGFWEFVPVDPRNVSFTWEPKPTVKVANFLQLKEVMVDFPCGHYSMFKPSIAEVLAWLPDDIKESANAFYIPDEPVAVYSSGSFQRAKVVFGKI